MILNQEKGDKEKYKLLMAYLMVMGNLPKPIAIEPVAGDSSCNEILRGKYFLKTSISHEFNLFDTFPFMS